MDCKTNFQILDRKVKLTRVANLCVTHGKQLSKDKLFTFADYHKGRFILTYNFKFGNISNVLSVLILVVVLIIILGYT